MERKSLETTSTILWLRKPFEIKNQKLQLNYLTMFLLRKYNELLMRRPLITKSLTGGVIFTLSDFIVQKHEQSEAAKIQKQQSYNWKRTGIAFTMGAVFMTPLFHYWFTYYLPAIVGKLNIPKTAPAFVRPLAFMLFDQTIWATFIISWYFLWVNILEHQSVEKGVSVIKNNIWETMINNWKIWPPAQMLNFWVIPNQYQVLWVNMIGFIWQIYLTYIQHK